MLNNTPALSKDQMKNIKGGLQNFNLWTCTIGPGSYVTACLSGQINPQSACGASSCTYDGPCYAGGGCA